MKTSHSQSVSRPLASRSHNVTNTKVLPRHRREEPCVTTGLCCSRTAALEIFVDKSAAEVASMVPKSCEEGGGCIA
jgi:hypothetical protein